MLKIRMQRVGRINTPAYRIVVIEHTASPKAGKFVEKVGSYNPKSKERVLNADRIKYWMSVGAKPSDTMHNMLVSQGIINAKKINVLPAFKAPEVVEEVPVAEAAPVEAPVAETPVEAPAAAEDASAEASAKEEVVVEEASPETPAAEEVPVETATEEAPAEEATESNTQSEETPAEA